MFYMAKRESSAKKILILAANPELTSSLRLDKEICEIDKGLTRAKHRDKFEFRQKLAVGIREIQQALVEYEPHIVHFIGHGEKEGLLVEGKQGEVIQVPPEALAGLFELCSAHVECVILSACYSVYQAESINRHIDYVIGMKKVISNEAAIEFAVGFYNALGAGKSIEESFKFGQIAIRLVPDLPEHLTPILIKREELEILNIQLRIQHTGDCFDVKVSSDKTTSLIKNRFIQELNISAVCENGSPVAYYLRRQGQDQNLDEAKSLRDNGVCDKEVLCLVIEADEGSRVRVAIGNHSVVLD